MNEIEPSFAGITIYDGLIGAIICRALLSGSVWVLCRAPRFFRIQAQLF
jgi:hypothetical protein